MKSILFSFVLLLSQSSFAARGGDGPGNSELNSLSCRVSSNATNYDFTMAAPKMEDGPFGFGGSIGTTEKVVQSGSAKLKVELSYINGEGAKIKSANGNIGKSVLLKITVLTGENEIMPYVMTAQSTSNVRSFSENIDSSVSIDTTPLGFEGKHMFWCSTTPIR